jgi:hypothetical protein
VTQLKLVKNHQTYPYVELVSKRIEAKVASIFKKSEEERAAEKVALEASQAKEKAEAQHRAWLTTPIGMATTAKESGNGFFEIELVIGSSMRSVSFGSADFGKHNKSDFTGLLSQIESLGWKLEHVGYYFMITGETSRDKFMASGQNTAVNGRTMGVYLFRNLDNL